MPLFPLLSGLAGPEAFAASLAADAPPSMTGPRQPSPLRGA